MDPHLLLGRCADELSLQFVRLEVDPAQILTVGLPRLCPSEENWYIRFFHQYVICASLSYRRAKQRALQAIDSVESCSQYQQYLDIASIRLLTDLTSAKEDPRFPAMQEMVKVALAGLNSSLLS